MATTAYIPIFFIFFECIRSDWVEIAQVSTKYQKPEQSTIVQEPTSIHYTTPSNYEIFMRTPSFNNGDVTTPAYVNKFNINRMDASVENLNTATTAPNNVAAFTEFFEPENSRNHENATGKEFEQYEEPEAEDDSKINDAYNFNYNGFMPFLESVQKTLLETKDKSVYSKLSVLRHLRDHLLADIATRMSNLWKPKESASEARGYKDEDSHMDFPSNEGALMTIGFLTFAVFLIKLVLKLIYALKYKQQYYATVPPPTTGVGLTYIGRKKRSDTAEEAAKILQLIDEYKFR